MKIRKLIAASAGVLLLAAAMSFPSLAAGWQQTEGGWYYLGNDDAMAEQTDAQPVMGHWEGCTFVNDWSNIRLTVPQDFIRMDSVFLSAQRDSIAGVDMLSMKNRECAVMILYTANKDGDAADGLMSFLNMFHDGFHQIAGVGTIENVKVGNLQYIRCYFPGSEENPGTGCLYLRNLGSFYSLIITVSNPENASAMDSILSTLTTAR